MQNNQGKSHTHTQNMTKDDRRLNSFHNRSLDFTFRLMDAKSYNFLCCVWSHYVARWCRGAEKIVANSNWDGNFLSFSSFSRAALLWKWFYNHNQTHMMHCTLQADQFNRWAFMWSFINPHKISKFVAFVLPFLFSFIFSSYFWTWKHVKEIFFLLYRNQVRDLTHFSLFFPLQLPIKIITCAFVGLLRIIHLNSIEKLHFFWSFI